MIKQENPNFVASFYAPNPMEVTYWIDLSYLLMLMVM